MTETVVKNQNLKKYINIVIMFALYFIVSALPPFGGITE